MFTKEQRTTKDGTLIEVTFETPPLPYWLLSDSSGKDPREFTLQDIQRLPPCLLKKYCIAKCYTPYVYTSLARVPPDGLQWDGREDGRYFLFTSAGTVQESVRNSDGYYESDFVELLDPADLWRRLFAEHFVVKWEEFYVFPSLRNNEVWLEIRTHLRHYGPGRATEVLVESILDTKWLAEDASTPTTST